jgi:two-component system nitrate/nitrite response regulator NarL
MANRRVLLVGTNWLLRQGFRPLLKKLQLVIGGEGGYFAEAYQGFSRTGPPDMPDIVMFLVCSTDDISSALTQLRKVRNDFLESKLVVVAERPSTQDVIGALQAGADGIVSSNISDKLLLNSLQLIMLSQRLFSAWPPDLHVTQKELVPVQTRGDIDEPPLTPSLHLIHIAPQPGPQRPLPLSLAPRLVHRGAAVTNVNCGPPLLSDREWQVLRCLAQGQCNKLIARELRVAETTIKVHIKSLLKKLGAANRTQAAILGLSHDEAQVPGELAGSGCVDSHQTGGEDDATGF